MSATNFANQDLLPNADSAAALREIVDICARFAAEMPPSEAAQAAALAAVIAAAGNRVRSGALRVSRPADAGARAVRLYKAPIGRGRLKLQLFPLDEGDAHPPHAHHDLVSCQVVLTGGARVREYSLLRRLPGRVLELRQEPVKLLAPGDGVYTLRRRNNIHWQQGMQAGTLLLNMNWQGFFADRDEAAESAVHGRTYLDWSRVRPAGRPGHILVPEAAAP